MATQVGADWPSGAGAPGYRDAFLLALTDALRSVADAHSCDIATVASRVMLQREGVAAVIVGATNASHLEANARIGAVELDSADLAAIDAVVQRHIGPDGDVFTLERDREGRHGRIMKYDLNR